MTIVPSLSVVVDLSSAFLYLGIIVVEPALELVVPAPDVEHGAIGERGFAAG
ncbi:MAG: hypothetical protein ACLSWY_08175 [Ruthenibacterium lactatiformans]